MLWLVTFLSVVLNILAVILVCFRFGFIYLGFGFIVFWLRGFRLFFNGLGLYALFFVNRVLCRGFRLCCSSSQSTF